MAVHEPKIIESGTQHDLGSTWSERVMAANAAHNEYRDKSLIWICPTRGFYHFKVVGSWDRIQWPVNQKRTGRLDIAGMEVGKAYDWGFKTVCATGTSRMGHPQHDQLVDGCKFIMTTEEDNIIPPEAIQMLLDAIYTCIDCGKSIDGKTWACEDGHRGLDGIGALYWTKGELNIPQAYGDPAAWETREDMSPRDVREAVAAGSVLEVNGIAMGCSIFRKALFDGMSSPWFKTTKTATQDLYMCRKAKIEKAARFAVHCGVRVGHIELETGRIF